MSPHFDTVSDEVNILYAASNRLTQASTPAEWLEAISGYARDQGATTGVLLYIENDPTGYPEWAEIVAYWTAGAGLSADLAARFATRDMPNFVSMWTRAPDRPLFIPDALSNPGIDDLVRGLNARYNMHSTVVLPLNNKGRWVGFVMFTWSEERHFDERDQRIFTAMIQQAAPVIDSMRLYDDSRERATRAEHLLRVNMALSMATNETQILDAIALYAAPKGAFAISMDYKDYAPGDEVMHPSLSWSVSVWLEGQSTTYEPPELPMRPTQDFGIDDLVRYFPDRCLFVENLLTDERLTSENRDFIRENLRSRAMVVLPIFSGGRYQAGMTIMWLQPHLFSEEEKYVFTALLQTLSATIASRRAYLTAEEARQESELLYRASKGINAAITFTEIVEAVDSLNLTGLSPGLSIFENYDFDQATYLELTAKSRKSTWVMDRRIAFDDIPLIHHVPRREILVVEDTSNRDMVDEISAATLEAGGVRSLIDVALSQGNRWLGTLSFGSGQPRKFTALEQRLAVGVGDMVAAAVERIRLRERSDASRIRAELVAQVNAGLSQATDEQSILSAVSLLAERYDVSLSTLAYLDIGANDELRAINIVALRSEDGRSPLPLSFLPVTYFRVEDYPILQVAYDNPDEPTFIDDLLTHPITETSNTRSFFETVEWRATILIPLRTGDQWQGLLTFIWNKPQLFSDDMQRLFTAILAPAAAVVATRRAYVAEGQARSESELLYRASEAINAANTYHEIVNAITLLDIGTHNINLTIWENYDFDQSSYGEVVAVATTGMQFVGQKYLIDDFPILHKMPRKGLWLIEDVAQDTRIDSVSRASWLKDNVLARIGVPLTLNNRWMGNLAFHHAKPKSYSELEKRLISGIGDLVTAAVERIRLREQTDLARQRAEQLAQVNTALSQATDEWSILEAVSKYLAHLNPDFLTLNYIEVDTKGAPVSMIPRATWQNGAFAPDHATLNQTYDLTEFPATNLWMHDPDSALVISDMATDERADELARSFMLQIGYAALIVIPLYGAGRWQAIIACSWQTPRPFTQADKQFCEMLIQSAGAVVASRRAYLAEERTRREVELRAHELETIAKVSAVAASVLNEAELLDTVALLTRLSFEQYQILIYLLDETGENLVQATRPMESTETFHEHRVPVESSGSLLARAVQTRQGVIVNDIAHTPEYSLTPILPQAQSELAVPMIVADRLIGVVDVQSPEVDRFTQEDVRIMSTLADLIAVAVENARLYQGAQEIAAFEERTRLARELHDSVSQALYGIALGTRTARILYDRDPTKLAEPLDYVMSLAQAGLTEMRALIFELRPESLENEGLVMALTKQAESVQARHGVKVQVDMGEEPSFAFELKEAIYRIAREALHNIVKHANASQVTLHLSQQPDAILLWVEDDGKGFDTSADFPGHLGLHSMRERTERLKGDFSITSAPGQGTRITVRIPCE